MENTVEIPSMAPGVLLAILTGLSWVVTGAFVGLVERRGRSAGELQFARACYLLAATLSALAIGRASHTTTQLFSLCLCWRPALLMVAWGTFSYAMTVCMGRAMAHGPNGAVWTIVQSGFIFPFAMGVALGNTALTAPRAAGIALVVLGVAFGGMARVKKEAAADAVDAQHMRPQARRRAAWLLPALGGFLFCGVNQCAVNLVSYLPAAARPAQLERIAWGSFGMLAARLVHVLFAKRRFPSSGNQPRVSVSFVWKVGAVEAVVWLFAGLFLLYNALDILQGCGRAAIATPIMTASCFVGFLLYGTLSLRECPNIWQALGFASSISGIALMA